MALTEAPRRRGAPRDRGGLPVALDLDGTLIDARGRQAGVAAEAMRELTGEELDRPRFWRRKRGGASTRQALEQLGYPSGTAIAVARRWSERIESEEWLARDRALDGSARALSDLRRAGVTVAVLTARREPRGAHLSLRSAYLRALGYDPARSLSEALDRVLSATGATARICFS